MNFKNLKALFFENKGIKQTIIKNTFWLAVAEGISRLLGVVLIIYVARILGATEFGKFAFALTFVSILAVFSDFGLFEITIREFSRDPKNEKKYPAILSLKIILSIGALILMLIGSFFVISDPAIRKIIWILAIYILTNNFILIFYAFLRARQKMEYEAGAKILQSLIINGIGFFVFLKIPSIESISYGFLFASLVALLLILLFFHFRIQSLKLILDKAVWCKFLELCWPLGLVSAFSLIYMNIDSVIMGYFGQITQTGYYNAAYRIVSAAIIPSILIGTALYPALSKLLKESKEKLQKVWNYYMESMIVLALPVVIGGVTLSSKIIMLFYNFNYNPAIFALQILIFVAGITLLCNPYGIILIIFNQQKKYLWINLIAVVVNITLNLILIPRYSLYGAAITALITYIVLFLLLANFSKRFTSISVFNLRLFKILVMAILSSLTMFIVISQPLVYNFNVILTIIVGILVYFITLFLFYKFSSRFNLLLKNL